ncbi:MAG TPA: hypothetical protein EYO59_10780 [Chromatiaceae bacterium]|nr:hypothetical protein [Chromatiaceae bacterium]
MPILVDLNQVAISNLMVSLGAYNKTFELNEDLIRHMILNSLRAYRVKFQEEYGELVICCDGKTSWINSYVSPLTFKVLSFTDNITAASCGCTDSNI